MNRGRKWSEYLGKENLGKGIKGRKESNINKEEKQDKGRAEEGKSRKKNRERKGRENFRKKTRGKLIKKGK